MPMYRKKPVVIEAHRYSRLALEAERVAKWCGGNQTDEGPMTLSQEITALARDLAEANGRDWSDCGVYERESYRDEARRQICMAYHAFRLCLGGQPKTFTREQGLHWLDLVGE